MANRSSFTACLAAILLTPLQAHSVAAAPIETEVDAPGAFVADQAHKAARAFAEMIEENYLYPGRGKTYADMLREKLKSGAYRSFESDRDFTAAVERDLTAVHPDLHLHLIAPSVPRRGVVGTASYPSGTCPAVGMQIERSMGRAGWIAPGIAYVEFCAFRESETDLAALKAFLDEHRNARVLIIDNRNNNGGAFAESDLIYSRLYRSRKELLRLEIRRSVDEKDPFPFADDIHWEKLPPTPAMARYSWFAVPDAKMSPLGRARVYVLTSRWTESAGEAFALALKRTQRATVIGETTQGAGHLAPTWGLPGEYRGQVPIGRIYDPRTGKGWEGTGVTPNIRSRADLALDRALELAGVNVAAAKQKWRALPTAQAAVRGKAEKSN